jgi:hypothetical protein
LWFASSWKTHNLQFYNQAPLIHHIWQFN